MTFLCQWTICYFTLICPPPHPLCTCELSVHAGVKQWEDRSKCQLRIPSQSQQRYFRKSGHLSNPSVCLHPANVLHPETHNNITFNGTSVSKYTWVLLTPVLTKPGIETLETAFSQTAEKLASHMSKTLLPFGRIRAPVFLLWSLLIPKCNAWFILILNANPVLT